VLVRGLCGFSGKQLQAVSHLLSPDHIKHIKIAMDIPPTNQASHIICVLSVITATLLHASPQQDGSAHQAVVTLQATCVSPSATSAAYCVRTHCTLAPLLPLCFLSFNNSDSEEGSQGS
jgi:hypothetical protein